jgi:hypothetical protein
MLAVSGLDAPPGQTFSGVRTSRQAHLITIDSGNGKNFGVRITLTIRKPPGSIPAGFDTIPDRDLPDRNWATARRTLKRKSGVVAPSELPAFYTLE